MTDIIRCFLLLVDAFFVIGQLSTWSMNYGFALGVGVDIMISALVGLLLLLRAACGPVSLPFMTANLSRMLYVGVFGAFAAFAGLRVLYCQYLRQLLLEDWPREDKIRNVRLDYYVMESITWLLQLVLSASLTRDVLGRRGRGLWANARLD